MSTSPKPPERLAEILLEILTLSDPTRIEHASGSDPLELADTQSSNEQAQRKDEEDHNNRPPGERN